MARIKIEPQGRSGRHEEEEEEKEDYLALPRIEPRLRCNVISMPAKLSGSLTCRAKLQIERRCSPQWRSNFLRELKVLHNSEVGPSCLLTLPSQQFSMLILLIGVDETLGYKWVNSQGFLLL